MKHFLSIFLLTTFGFSVIGFGQEEKTEEEQEIKVPEYAMQQVVPRILKWYFKPRNKPKKIYLAERGIKKEWLPEIKNIEFVLVPEEKLGQRGDIYVFKAFEFSKGIYDIGFGYGEPNCSTIGDMWYIRISKQKVRLWQNGENFGSGCSYNYVPNGFGSAK